jgi:hypothetical protein
MVRLLRIFIILAWCLALLAGFLAAALLLTGLLTRSLILLAGLVLVRHAVSFHGNGVTTVQTLRRSDKRKMPVRIDLLDTNCKQPCPHTNLHLMKVYCGYRMTWATRNWLSGPLNSKRNAAGSPPSVRRTLGKSGWPKAPPPSFASRMRVAMSDLDLDELRAELDDFAQPEARGGRSPREERIIAGFEEIQRFVEQYGRAPQHGEDKDIFERLYAVRLDRMRALEECRSLLTPSDHQALLAEAENRLATPVETMDEDELLAELEGAAGASDITELRHVRTAADKRTAEEIANRAVCEDFERFKPLFDRVGKEIEAGVRITRQIRKDAGFLKADIKVGEFFILGGQTAYIAEVGEPIKAPNGEFDARLRVIYSNATESNLLLRSLQRALYKDETSRRVSEPTAGPLFSAEAADGDLASGTIYVLRSKSDHPAVAANRDILHKIGVTGGDVGRRIANAKLDPTFLMAEVEIVASYELYNINRTKLENVIHRVFDPARLDIEIKDRFGNPVIPREWFLVPVFVVDEAVERIKDGTITGYTYDPRTASLRRTAG